MDPRALTPALRVLRLCLHLLFGALLVLAAVRAALRDDPRVVSIVGVVVVVAVVYAVGPRSDRVGRSVRAAVVWLTVLGIVWLVLLTLTPDGIWLAFPLFFLQLHLLPGRWSVPVVVATTIAAVGGFAWHRTDFSAGMVIGPVIGAAVAVATVLGYQALYRESEERRRLIDALVATRAELAAAERSAGTLAERERLAREIHDTLAQGLSSIQLLLRAAERAVPDRPEAAGEYIRNAREAAQDNLAEARRFVRALTPPSLEGGTLSAALERLCGNVSAANADLDVRFASSGAAVELPTAYEVALLRVGQSALANTARHSGAGRAELTLSYMETSVSLDIVDDGSGFDPDVALAGRGESGEGFGLAAMRARARSLGGSLSVESGRGQGTAVAITLPLPGGA